MLDLLSIRKEMEKARRQYGVYKYAIQVMPDEQGLRGYSLCVRMERHYVLRGKLGVDLKLPLDFKPCDGSCLQKGEFIEIKDQSVRLQMGFLVKLPADQVLILKDDRLVPENKLYYDGGSVFSPETVKRSIALKNGESVQVERKLPPGKRINLTPMANRGGGRFNRQHEKVVETIIDTVKNVNGKAVVTNNEAELRAAAHKIDLEFQASVEKSRHEAEQLRKQRAKEIAQEVGRQLRWDYGFSYEQVGQLFAKSGVTYAIASVARSRQKMTIKQTVNMEIMAYAYHSPNERKHWSLIEAGADYIISIGGVPADKK